MFQLQIQYTCDDLKEAFQSIDRCNCPRLSRRGRVLTAAGLVGLIVAVLVAAVMAYIANGPGAGGNFVFRVYVLVLTDLFVLGFALLPLLFISHPKWVGYMSALALILCIEIVLKNIGHAVFPSIPAATSLPANSPGWIRFLGNNSLFWSFMLGVLWMALYLRLSRMLQQHRWNLLQQLPLPTEVTITEEAIRFRTATVDRQYQWQAFCRWLETPKLFILQPSFATMEIIPKRCCRDQSEVDALRVFLRAGAQLAPQEERIAVPANEFIHFERSEDPDRRIVR